jgi:hydrogenase expression/formation protein
LDLEEHARQLYKSGLSAQDIIKELTNLTASPEKAEAILFEVNQTENISDKFIRDLSGYKFSGYTAEDSGLGCRGEGDFFIHRKLSEIIHNRSSIIDPHDQDDAGVVKVDENYIIVSVDGMHSRLSHFPFLAGFHATRAAIRDTLMMGSEPKALLSDIHLANDGDVAKIFDYTAGIAVVSELSDIPLVSGSTLRIGGDLVLGDRLTGCVGCVGYGPRLTPRRDVVAGDVLIMTEGHGGGTIATTALYNGFSNVVSETLNLKNIGLGKKLLNTNLLNKIHCLTDITNGGIRGDAFEIAKTANVRISLFETPFTELINTSVLNMLENLEIDPLGVSIDSLLFILPQDYVDDIFEFLNNHDIKSEIIGRVEPIDTKKNISQKCGVQLLKTSDDTEYITKDLEPKFREEPYTPIKKIVNNVPANRSEIQSAIDKAMKISLEKKEELKNWITTHGRI